MMSKIRTAVVVLCAFWLSVAYAARTQVKSPDGLLSVEFSLDRKGCPGYSVSYRDREVIRPSRMGFKLSDGTSLADGFGMGKVSYQKCDSLWAPVWGENDSIRENYNGMTIPLTKGKTRMDIEFRVFNDGIGFRYVIRNHPGQVVTVQEEATTFAMTGDHTAWWIPEDYDSQEYEYTESRLGAITAPGVQTSLMMKTDDGIYLNLHEASLVDFPAMHLRLDKESLTFRSHLTPRPDGTAAEVSLPFRTPWRTVTVSDKATGILSSNLILNLNEPCKIADTSWIRPVKYMGVWWEMITGKSKWSYTDATDFDLSTFDYSTARPHGRHGASNENVRRYIDFASRHGFDQLLVEGWNTGWEDWYGKEKDYVFDFVTPYPDFDIKALNDYAREKGIRLMMHHETSGSVGNYERHLDAAYDLMNKYGYNTVKSGYVGKILPKGEYHYSQDIVRHYMNAVKKAADRRIMVNAHEAVRPTGLCRTWPNLMANESAMGQEYAEMSPRHVTILPFTRLQGGPMDFTPGIFRMDITSFAPGYQGKRKRATIPNQLALYLTMYSPVQMAGDLPEHYERHMDAFQFIKDVPVDWSRSVYLDAEPGDYLVVARKDRNSPDWYVGGVTNEDARDYTLRFGFLPAGEEYECTVYSDASDGDGFTNPEKYEIYRTRVTSTSELPLRMARAGGFAIRLQRILTPVYLDKTKPIEERVEDALSRMTLEEKVALCHAQGKFSSPGVRRLGIPEIWMSDGPHGVRAEINWNDWGHANWTNDSITAFPALTALAATWNPEMSAIYGKNVGEEARYREKDVLLGPGVNIYRTPLNGRNFEYMGEDPYLAGEMVVPYIQELQKNGVAACVKHFALNNQEKWRGNINVKVSDRALYEIYLPAFKRAVQDGKAWSIMGAYNKIWDEHCCHNSRLLNDILRSEWGFDGVVVTDWGGAHDTKQAALNGLDIEMGSFTNGLTSESEFGYNDYYLADPYLNMIKSGEVPASTVNDKARNILRLIFRTSMNTDKPFGSVATPEHYAAAKAIGDESIVLLKNNGILPLSTAKYKNILVVGENAVRKLTEGGGSSELKVKDLFTPLEALRHIYGDGVKFAEGYRTGRAMFEAEDILQDAILDSLRNEAVTMARAADVVIYIGGLNKNAFQDCESTDRREYNLPWNQDKLIEELLAVNPNVIVANISGNAYAMPWIDKVPAVLQSWYLGTMIGPSMADVISGKVNPSGKLPFSFPKRLEDNGAHHFGEISYPGVEGKNPQEEYLEDIFVGYRWHDAKKIPALFPFGYGLSYTTFKYGKASLSSKEISADGFIMVTIPVTNTGKVEGKEIVQLYIQDEKSSLPRPLKELKGFRKINLAPEETKNVTFTITPEDLKFFDDSRHEWVAEPGRFKVLIGSSSTDIRSTAQFSYK